MDNQRARTAALLLGVGLGGFFDGIVLHQIAQWHQMLLWALTLTGVLLLRGAVRGAGPIPSTRGFIGYLLIGWGAFNLVQGIALYDWLLLLVGGAGLIVLGYVLRDRVPLSARVEAERRSGFDRRLSAR